MLTLIYPKANVKELEPYARYLRSPTPIVALPGQSAYAEPKSVLSEAVHYGWCGRVEITVCLNEQGCAYAHVCSSRTPARTHAMLSPRLAEPWRHLIWEHGGLAICAMHRDHELHVHPWRASHPHSERPMLCTSGARAQCDMLAESLGPCLQAVKDAGPKRCVVLGRGASHMHKPARVLRRHNIHVALALRAPHLARKRARARVLEISCASVD